MRIPHTSTQKGQGGSSSRWILRSVDADALAHGIPQLAERLVVPPLVARLLWLRGIRSESRARRFLRPRLADLSPPEGLPNLDAAAERLARAVREGTRIAVCGDYDVDGMTGTSLLLRFFRLAGADVTWSIPDRERDGYGLTVPTIERLAREGVRLLVTVDNGITAVDALKRARELGLDAVVTDHHLPGAELPPAHAIVNPHLPGSSGEASSEAALSLCGCALAFKVAWAIADRLRGRVGGRQEDAFRSFLRDAVGLVALATVADVVPLLEENRILVSSGLQALRASTHPGIQALMEVAQVGAVPLTTEDVAFKLAPRLNAAGRLCRPELVVDLLTASDAGLCRELARELDAANTERRRIEQGVLKEADEAAQGLLETGDRPALVVWGQGWHVGVVGIVAARLVDKYARPAVVIGLNGPAGRGSCRTVPHVNVHAALERTADCLESHGGHAMAAGLDILEEHVETFREAFEAAVTEQLEGQEARHTLHIDAETGVDEWDLDAVHSIHRLAPFGSHNPEPVFVVRGAQVAGKPRLMGQASAHLSFAIRQARGAIRVVGFRQAARYDLAASGQPLDMAVTPVVNDWRGVRTPEFRLLDMRAQEN